MSFCLSYLCGFFCVFKQKTAYEMRISDWSSDVCSSDLWRKTGGSELANTQSFISGLFNLLGLEPPAGSRTDDAHNDYVFERRVFQDNGDGTQSFGRIEIGRAHV